MRHALCQVLKHGDEPSDCESSCPCYYSQIEGLGLHVVYITRYVIRIKKHLHNQIGIIEIVTPLVLQWNSYSGGGQVSGKFPLNRGVP